MGDWRLCRGSAFGSLAIAAAATACGNTQLSGVETSAQASTLARARPCRSDSIYIDVPLSLNPTWTSTSFLPGLEQSLANVANSGGHPEWFCGEDQVTCPNNSAVVTVDTVLPQRSGQWRSDGHLRFFRVHFWDFDTGAALQIRPGKLCAAVAAVRNHFVAHSSAAPDQIFVGRECDAGAQSVEPHATYQMLTWHLPRIGLNSNAVILNAAPAAEQLVDLALVDTGIAPAVAQSADLGIASQSNFVSESGIHAHGTAMSILQRQVAPAARMHSLRAMSRGGSGVSAELARAIDDALFGAASGDPTRPIVLNLSLGWPAQLGSAAQLSTTNPFCTTYEDPFGETVRYMLDVARRLDDDGTRSVFAVTAAGNQPLKVHPDLFPEAVGYTPLPSCPPAGSPPSGTPWFFPAEWQGRDSCRSAGASNRLAFGVSAIDDRDQIAGNAIPSHESPLVAPGQHVYASHAAADPTGGAPICSGGGENFGPVRLPSALSGSSVAAALVSAAAARGQTLRLTSGLPLLSWNGLARVMYLTGVDLCRVSGRLPVRRLDVTRFERALVACQPLIQCAEAISSAEALPPHLYDACSQPLISCRFETAGRNGRIARPCPRTIPQAVDWPAGYGAGYSSCTPSTAGNFVDLTSCDNVLCPFEQVPNRLLLGSLGPQPQSGGCPDCQLTAFVGPGQAMLTAEINGTLPPSTVLTDVYLILEGKDSGGQINKQYVAVDTQSPGWSPGGIYKVTLDISTLDFVWSSVSGNLIATMITSGKPAGTDVSPLRIDVQP